MKWRKLFGMKDRDCKHTNLVSCQELCKSNISEPGKESRDILLRVLYFRCIECKKTIRLFPRGIAHDPVSGIYRDESEPDKTEEVGVPENVRKEVLEYHY